MYFKRPSFRRGGSTGIGQLSSRVKARDGFMGMNFGVGQGDNTGYQKYLETMRANKSSGQPSGLAQLILGPRYTDPNYVSPFLKPDAPFFSNRTGFEFMNLGAQNNGSTNYMTDKGPTQTIEEEIKITSDADNLKTNVDAERDMQQIISEAERNFVPKKISDAATGDGVTTDDSMGTDESLGELSMKDSIEGEVGILKELLKNTGMSKGEKALLLAKAVGTPGTLKDKLDVGAAEALKFKEAERKQDKALILTAYKNYKSKELAGEKLNQQETAVKSWVNKKLASPDNKKDRNALELEAWDMIVKGKSTEKDANKEFAIASLASMKIEIQDAQRDVKLYAGKKDKASQKKYQEALEVLSTAKQYAEMGGITVPNLAEGGRVERALGSPMMGETTETTNSPEETVVATEVTAANNVEPMAATPKMDFADLRNRLPKEITDDIVQLLANSTEALQSFAYIKTQEDVNAFNIKYGVNLVLPPENV